MAAPAGSKHPTPGRHTYGEALAYVTATAYMEKYTVGTHKQIMFAVLGGYATHTSYAQASHSHFSC